MSDTHSMHDQVEIPDGDALIHAGDLTLDGAPGAVFEAFAWLSRLPHKNIIVTPGNHDFAFERVPQIITALRSKFPRVQILIDEEITVDGFRVWGAPWQPWFHDWAFNLPRNGPELGAKWAMIPDDTSILVTHGPPYGILDKTLAGEYVGCEVLKARVGQLSELRLHIFGHIHESYGFEMRGRTKFVNASSCNVRYHPIQAPIVVDLE